MISLTELPYFKTKLNTKSMFIVFGLALAFLFLVECTMSYYYPIALEGALGSNLSAGLVIGLCNIIALACDLVFPELFRKKTWKFLFLAAILIQIGFPLFTNLAVASGFVALFIVAGIFWNIYYEFMAFARQNYIVTNEKKEDYSRVWGIISIIVSLASIIGPILGSEILNMPVSSRFVVFGALQAITLIISLLLVSMSPHKEQDTKLKTRVNRKLSIFKDMKLWEILGSKVFPIIVVGVIISFINGSVMTFGGLMGVELFDKAGLDWIIVFTFAVPSILASLVLTRFPVRKFKKLLSQMLIILSGFTLCMLPFFRVHPEMIIIGFFLCSLFLSIAWIFNEAVYSDLADRAGEEKLYINGMERINDSIGYLFGPIIIGMLADRTDYYIAFSFIGFVCMIIGIILMMTTPRKIMIPHQEIAEAKKK